VEEMGEEVAAFAEDATQDSGDGEHELPVRDIVADAGGDPAARATNTALVAGGAEMPALAGESEQFFVTAVRALEAGETGCEVTTAEEGLDGHYGAWAERAEGLAVMLLVVREKVIPAVVDDLPEG
jgi:hypothetical protein